MQNQHLSDYSKTEIEEDTSKGPKFREVPVMSRIAPHILQAGTLGEFLPRRLGEPNTQPAGEGSLSLAQWEAQWQEFLRMLENPQSEWRISPLPGKPSPWEDAKAFLASFEQVAEACRWPQEKWLTRLLPALSGEAEKAFDLLNVREREDYETVKAAILREGALSREKQREEFRNFCYQEAEGPRGAYRRLREMCCGWLRVENCSKEQILELLILEQLLSILPPEIQSRVRESRPENCSEAVALAEEFLSRQEKQVPLEEAAGSISEAGQGLSTEAWGHLWMGIEEEEGREAGPLARSTDEMPGEFQRSTLEYAEEEESQENCQDPAGIKRKEGADTDEKRDKPLPFQGGGIHEIPVQEERPYEELKMDWKEKENEDLSVGKTFQERNIFPQEQIHLGDSPYNCLEYGKCFSHQTALTAHQRIHSGGHEEDEELNGSPLDKAKNQKLKRNFQDQDGPKRQRGNPQDEKRDPPDACQGVDCFEINHTEEETFKCLEGGIDFSDEAQYNTHLQKSFTCTSEPLSQHRSHSTGQPFSSSSCGKSTSPKPKVIPHQRIHIEQKPLILWGSGESFRDNQNGNLRYAKHTWMKPCKCFQCEQYFTFKSQSLNHQITHLGENPLECSECGKRFKWRSSFDRHQRAHTGEKPFECPVCGKKLSQSGSLKQHLRTHTGEKPFECSECGKKFSRSNYLQQHLRTHRRETF